MKKLFVTALALFVGSATLAANTYALSPQKVRSFENEYAFRIVQDREVANLIQNVLMQDFINSVAVSGPATLLGGRFLAVSGCVQHNCPDNTLIVIDSNHPEAILIARNSSDDMNLNSPTEFTKFVMSEAWMQVHGFQSENWPWLVVNELNQLGN